MRFPQAWARCVTGRPWPGVMLGIAVGAAAVVADPGADEAGTFRQGLWRGEDPRVEHHGGWYYHVENAPGPGPRLIYRSKSLLDRGAPRPLPEGFPLFAPIRMDDPGGSGGGAWYAFDTEIWECRGDPYESAPDGWKRTGRLPFTHWSIDHFVFRAESGPHRGGWFIVWAGQEREDDPATPEDERRAWWFENIYISRLVAGEPGGWRLETPGSSASNRIVSHRFHTSKPMRYPVPPADAGAWKDVVAEAPCVVQRNGTISLIYSGDGAHTSHYAMGIAFCADGDVLNPRSWVDWNEAVVPGPEFSCDAGRGVFGPGVARVVPSPDGREDWIYYHSKVWDTWNRSNRAEEEAQQTRGMWARFINLHRIGWREVVHQGRRHTLPLLGRPVAPGALIPRPGGDPGPAARGAVKVEAEKMIPFGEVMSPAVQDAGGGEEVTTLRQPGASGGACVGSLGALAAGAADRKAGLICRNVSGARGLVLSASSPQEGAGFDLYVNGDRVRFLPVACTGGWDRFVENAYEVRIPPGAELRLVHEAGRHAEARVDFLVLKP